MAFYNVGCVSPIFVENTKTLPVYNLVSPLRYLNLEFLSPGEKKSNLTYKVKVGK